MPSKLHGVRSLELLRSAAAIASWSSSFTTSLTRTKQLHALLITTSILSLNHPITTTDLLRSYVSHSDLPSARRLFDRCPSRTPLLWNSIIRAYARLRQFPVAYTLFDQMRHSAGSRPDCYTFACVLRACAENSDANGVDMIHAVVLSTGLGSSLLVTTALVNSYSKLGRINNARMLFDKPRAPDLVLWNSIIAGYGYGGFWQEGLELFRRMRETDKEPDGYTIVALVSCFCSSSVLQFAKGVHGFCLKGGYDDNSYVRSALVSMYSRCRFMDMAYQIFRCMNQPDLVTWSALISGFSLAGQYKEALTLLGEMTSSGKRPDAILVACALSACASIAAARPGKEIHCYSLRTGIHLDHAVSCGLIDMYSKCGFSDSGYLAFELMPEKNVVAYNAAISNLGSHGLFNRAFFVFECMLKDGYQPDAATFSALLCACCHSGLMDEGLKFFNRMKDQFGIESQMEHYVYMVKLLAMAGKLKDAYDLIHSMPMPADSGVWGALLWGCNIHGNLDMGRVVAEKLFEIHPDKTAYRVMLSNIYAAEKKWEVVERLRKPITVGGFQKSPGFSWIGGDVI
ncbi:putative pentatricopeptide repeat-containing protein At1g64310 [Zingiber officinale]|uniref:Pentatricopeptide repeat-containing protein n=1 Tax=Zingiber officinale TaxID=94328 RepID=A0A8J5I5E2_ZINOF|nr:putative pentatricopeptide repeat-containing protein At1g64310 [Zingiber officinale]KAG6537516.1 hypothetical protein ZIOFF_002610 [Zingiber officinale]